MTKDQGTGSLRQWRVTITEDRDGAAWWVMLSWRSFPCRADHWDAHKSFTIEQHARAPITSQEALKVLLGEIAVGEWREGLRPRY